jgi:hypothetical protein
VLEFYFFPHHRHPHSFLFSFSLSAMAVLSFVLVAVLSLLPGLQADSHHLVRHLHHNHHDTHRRSTNSNNSVVDLSNRQDPNNGRYDFLVSGYSVPLISTVGINSKVYFLDKKYDPGNDTGAYELDPSMVGAGPWQNAWRTLNVDDEIFCSASLVLPDKAGRIINIAGWSDSALYGIRLLTPDGKPGVPGINDWQEDMTNAALQRPRWYASAVILSNGSMLVMGGEDTNSGNEQPNLEVLPRIPGGDTTVYLDFLAQTYPFNLYPLLFVLPSGNLFVVYFNQARILDQVTFNTVLQSPNVPASAPGDFDGGRTYPYSGAGMILPIKAPYTDPMTILVCGGATQEEVGLDTCVSISPEVGGAQWTVEQMPSQRVMSCMVALPDGTYLIMNGAQLGVSGFASASDPNLTPVLYDPSLPVGQRMRELSSTTIARLYHSESSLLPDGSVIVSGSDPQDPRYPQEYRHEIFSPPYLLSGAQRPAFAVGNSDWAYGGKYAIKVKSPSMANIGITLIGAASSTHGNSMGSRTMMPDFMCVGFACLITAPPNAGVCPPGWFMLFVLDGPTPSKAVWVRIGGDPAQIGNWPPGPVFTRPGV